MNTQVNPSADSWWDIVPGDAEEGPHLLPPHVEQAQSRPHPLTNSYKKSMNNKIVNTMQTISWLGIIIMYQVQGKLNKSRKMKRNQPG